PADRKRFFETPHLRAGPRDHGCGASGRAAALLRRVRVLAALQEEAVPAASALLRQSVRVPDARPAVHAAGGTGQGREGGDRRRAPPRAAGLARRMGGAAERAARPHLLGLRVSLASYPSLRIARGRGTILRSKMVEGASDSPLRFRYKSFVTARAPSTILRSLSLAPDGPPPPLRCASRGRMKKGRQLAFSPCPADINGREVGGGRATRQPGQVRKEAALTSAVRVARQPPTLRDFLSPDAPSLRRTPTLFLPLSGGGKRSPTTCSLPFAREERDRQALAPS